MNRADFVAQFVEATGEILVEVRPGIVSEVEALQGNADLEPDKWSGDDYVVRLPV